MNVSKIRNIAFDCYTGKHESFDEILFAELIIKECIAQVDQSKASPFVSLDDATRIGHFVDIVKYRIKDHFGVSND